jgi:hypothetical protein
MRSLSGEDRRCTAQKGHKPMTKLPEFDDIKDAFEFINEYDYSNLGNYGTYNGKKILLVFSFSRLFTPKVVKIRSRYLNKATYGAISEVVKSQALDAASAMFNASKGNIFGTLKSLFKMGTSKYQSEEEWLDSIRNSDEEVYMYGMLDRKFRERALLSRIHIIENLCLAQKGPVYAGSDLQDGRLIYFFRITI